MAKMTKKKFAEYVFHGLRGDHSITFRGSDENETFCIANIVAGDSTHYIANRSTGGYPFCFWYGFQAPFTEYGIDALRKYLNAIPSFADGVEICSEDNQPSVESYGRKLFISQMWYLARWGEKKSGIYRIESPKKHFIITFRVIPFGTGAIVIAQEPLYNTENVQFCCDVMETTNMEDFHEKVAAYLETHDIGENDNVEVYLYM